VRVGMDFSLNYLCGWRHKALHGSCIVRDSWKKVVEENLSAKRSKALSLILAPQKKLLKFIVNCYAARVFDLIHCYWILAQKYLL
jgi:hypothetical protein